MTAKPALLIMAVLSTLYAAAAFATGFNGDFTVASIIAVACLAAVFYIDHKAYLRWHARQWRRSIEED